MVFDWEAAINALPDVESCLEDSVPEGSHLVEPASIHVGDYILIGGRPCEVIKMNCLTRKITEPHFFCFDGIDIFTEKRLSGVYLRTDSVNVPVVTKKKYRLLDYVPRSSNSILFSKDYESFTLLDTETGKITDDDHKVRDKQLYVDIKKNFNDGKILHVTVISAMGESAIIDFTVIF